MASIEPTIYSKEGIQFIIRSVQEDDAEELLEFVPRLDQETDHMLGVPGEFQLSAKEEREFIRQKIPSKCDLFLIATVEDQIVGSLGFTGSMLQRFQHQGEFGMGVLRTFWGKGIGSALPRPIGVL